MARFLVIDDDSTIRQLIGATLEKAGHSVAEAATGAEGVAQFNLQRPDIVFTDVVMPEDSIETVIELSQQHPAVPFVVVSGLTTSDKFRGVTQALGARYTLPKPFRLAEFLKITEAVLAELKPARPDEPAKR